MPETVELRIEGIVVVQTEYVGRFEQILEGFLQMQTKSAAYSLVNNPDPTGMSLYKVEEVEGLRWRINNYERAFKLLDERDKKNDEGNLKLAAQLEQKEKEVESCQKWSKFKDGQILSMADTIIDKNDKISTLETRLRLKSKFNPKHLIIGVIIGAGIVSLIVNIV